MRNICHKLAPQRIGLLQLTRSAVEGVSKLRDLFVCRGIAGNIILSAAEFFRLSVDLLQRL